LTLAALLYKRSLNKEIRKKDLLKITIENQNILRRLQDKQATYSVNRWDEEYRTTEKIKKNICEYPLIFDEAGVQRNITTAGGLDYNSDGGLQDRGL
jgi:hypothetical protein